MRRVLRTLVVISLAVALLLPSLPVAASPDDEPLSPLQLIWDWLTSWLHQGQSSDVSTTETETPTTTADAPQPPDAPPPESTTDDPGEGETGPDLNPDG